MSKQIVRSFTSYLANLTTKLTHYVKKQNLQSINHLTGTQFNDQNYKTKLYKKPDSWNYFQYFTYMLKLDTSHLIKLQRKTQAFSLKEDLHILTAISSNPNRIIVKILEDLSKDGSIYRTNFRNVLIKRSFQRLKNRYKFLSQNIKQQQLQFLTLWIQKNGLENKSFIEISSQNDFNKTGSNIIIVKKSQTGQDDAVKKCIQLVNRKRMNKVEEQSEANIIAKEDQQLRDQRTGKKKNHKNIQQIVNVNRIFQTPPIKILSSIDIPQAPKKIKQQQLSFDEVVQLPKKQRKIIRVIDAKKNVMLKQESQEHKISQSSNKKHPFVSQFQILTADQQQFKSSIISEPNKEQQLKEQESAEQQCLRLQNILQQFATKRNLSKMKILKYLDQVSGDLSDLRKFLQSQDKSLLWKRMQDAVIRKIYKKYENDKDRKQIKNKNEGELRVELLYNQILKLKGEQRVQKRIKYLQLNKYNGI